MPLALMLLQKALVHIELLIKVHNPFANKTYSTVPTDLNL